MEENAASAIGVIGVPTIAVLRGSGGESGDNAEIVNDRVSIVNAFNIAVTLKLTAPAENLLTSHHIIYVNDIFGAGSVVLTSASPGGSYFRGAGIAGDNLAATLSSKGFMQIQLMRTNTGLVVPLVLAHSGVVFS
jgi:hypothetical protein